MRSFFRTYKEYRTDPLRIGKTYYQVFAGEFWTSRQRQASRLHEIAYRACFKPQLPRFFIELFSRPDDVIYDPFSGRGTTALEAGLLGRNVIANDINPLSVILGRPRFFVPELDDIEKRLADISTDGKSKADIDLSMFYHPDTESEIVALKRYLSHRQKSRSEDEIDHWIRMVATNRLTGHSPGFFSVYTFPPNQAVSADRQKLINTKRRQRPEYRDVRKIILRKSRLMLKDLKPQEIETLRRIGSKALWLNKDARSTAAIPDDHVQLTVTSPPFLNIVQYAEDNWLRGWFNGIDHRHMAKRITISRTVEEWAAVMSKVFSELYRITRHGGWVAFEVGEVRNGRIKLEEFVIPAGVNAGFACKAVVIQQQSFTKTSNIWGVRNNTKGTNSNRIALFRKG